MAFIYKAKTAGLTLGLALFVVVGLLAFISAEFKPAASLEPGPIKRAVIAPAEQLGKAFRMVANHVKPAVVSVYSEKNITVTQPEFPFPFGNNFLQQFFGGQSQAAPQKREFHGQERGLGSGMIINKKGCILTNYHVVRGADHLKVRLADNQTFAAKVIGTGPKTDVAVIRIKGHVPADLPTVTLGNSGALHTGNMVLAIGAPFGLLHTVTEGIISATGRSNVGIADYEDFLQTDAAINPGNSGGPLVNMQGEVIGMNTAIATSVGQFAGVGFAIPSDMIKTMLGKLMRGEKIVRGQLGIIIQEMTPDLARQFDLSQPKGVLVSQVNSGSPAEKAGMEDGDVIIQYDGKTVNDVRQLRDLAANTAPGTKARIEVLRNGKEKTLTAIIGNQTPETGIAATAPESGAGPLTKLGLTVQTLTPGLAAQLGVKQKHGVVITAINPGSLASLAGLQHGDVILDADHQPIANIDDLEQVLAKAKNKNQVLLRVARSGVSLFIVLRMK